nr:MAG TPA: hypothetical protein [Caudoviricetes sp.]
MAKDDYQVVLYRLLVYLYACKKQEFRQPNQQTFRTMGKLQCR